MGLIFYDVANNDAEITVWDSPEFENYIIVLRFSNSDSQIKITDVVNMQPYGWKEIVANDLEDAAGKLAGEVAKYGKARHVILFSHGGEALVRDQSRNLIRDANGKPISRIFFKTNNSTGANLMDIYYQWRKRLEEEIPQEEKEAEEKYKNSRQAREERQAEREKKVKTLKSGSDAYYDNFREIEADKRKGEDEEREYNAHKSQIEEEKKRLNANLTPQIRADMASIKSLIECIKDGEFLILASCNSAYENSLIEGIMEDTGYRINIAGIRSFAAYSKDEKTGIMDGNQLIGKKNLKDKDFRFLLAREPSSGVLVFRPNKRVTSYTNMEVLRNDLSFE